MKTILGLDLGTNSIGWALVETDEALNPNRIIRLGSRIIPMSQDILGNFDAGNSISQTAERTRLRGVRRLRERFLLRRERLHRVLHVMKFLPTHYDACIGWNRRDNKTYGKFLLGTEPKLAWIKEGDGYSDFLFKDSFNEMVEDFKKNQPHLFASSASDKTPLIPYDWTIYYLRKKALQKAITKEELSWILLNFNQKRGYYQLRGEEEEEHSNKSVEYYVLKVVGVTADDSTKNKDSIWYNVVLENDWIYHRSSRIPLFDWVGKEKEFIVTTELNDDGTFKTNKEGSVKRSFRAPSDDDWTLLKKKTELDIRRTGKTVGCYIYDAIINNPTQKIRGKLVRTVERKLYKDELRAILEKQKDFHEELRNIELYTKCIEELYISNEAYRQNLRKVDFVDFFVNDILFYQRPLKSKKSLISNCPYESYIYKEDGEKKIVPLKCIAKSNPLFQEFRLWLFIQNLHILQRVKEVGGKLETDVDVTADFLPSIESYVDLFNWLNDRKEVKQDVLFQSFFKLKRAKGEEAFPYRWNYVEDKEYPCNETRSQLLLRLIKCAIGTNFLSKENEMFLWHILYSVEDKIELEKALTSFATKHNLPEEFVAVFKKCPPYKKEYGSYSEKAIKKMLPLMRMGKYWNEVSFHDQTRERIDHMLTGEYDESIHNKVREKAINLTSLSDFSGLPLWLVCYIVYDRHSESGDAKKWKSPQDIELYLKNEFKQHSLRNPIVEQVITETLRTVHDLWKAYGHFSEIHIELGREMKNPADKRARITRQISDNENTNLRIKSLLTELKNDSSIENVRPYSPSQQEILKIYEEGVLSSAVELPDDIVRISKMSQPTNSELMRYKLWLEQQYCSPYTGEVIPLSKLFTTAYEIEHIIPQSRYFDDSLSNKVICESEVNKLKDRMLGYEFITNHGSEIVDLGFGKKAKVLSVAEYEDFIKKNYGKNRSKMKKLLLEDIPNSFIERQMNDSRYISKVVKTLLSNIVREEAEQEVTSKNVILCTGVTTSILKQDWGLNDAWNRLITPRFVRLNDLTNSTSFGEWRENRFQIQIPLDHQKGFSKKRIDHRHHAMDALIIACSSRNHINYLSNTYAHKNDEKTRYDLRNKLRRLEDVQTISRRNGIEERKTIKVAKEFIKPWPAFSQDAQIALEGVVVSFKQNVRVINKTSNKIEHYGENAKRILETQCKGDSWAVRKSLHKDTVYGKVSLRKRKSVRLAAALENWQMIVDKEFKAVIRDLIHQYGSFDIKVMTKYFKDHDYKIEGKDVSKVDVYYFDNEYAATRKVVDASFNRKTIESITDTGIQKILLNHLNTKDGNPELAFSPEGIDDMNSNLLNLNDGKKHRPIYNVRVSEPLGNKFKVGYTGNKKDKYVEAAKGTNLFFAIYQSERGKRTYDTVPLNIIVERQKQGLSPVAEVRESGGQDEKLLFWLSPNDLVYVPTEEERENSQLVDFKTITKEQVSRIYKMVSSSGSQCFFIKSSVSTSIVNKEFSVLNKMEKSLDGEMIKEFCWKLSVDRIGNVVEYRTGL